MSSARLIKIRHTCIVVDNITETCAFYKGIGFQEISKMRENSSFIQTVVGINNADIRWVKLRTEGEYVLELIQYEQPNDAESGNRLHAVNAKGFSHIALETNNIFKLTEKIKSLGGSLISEPQRNPENTHIVCYSRDIEGNILELVQVV